MQNTSEKLKKGSYVDFGQPGPNHPITRNDYTFGAIPTRDNMIVCLAKLFIRGDSRTDDIAKEMKILWQQTGFDLKTTLDTLGRGKIQTLTESERAYIFQKYDSFPSHKQVKRDSDDFIIGFFLGRLRQAAEMMRWG